MSVKYFTIYAYVSVHINPNDGETNEIKLWENISNSKLFYSKLCLSLKYSFSNDVN